MVREADTFFWKSRVDRLLDAVDKAKAGKKPVDSLRRNRLFDGYARQIFSSYVESIAGEDPLELDDGDPQMMRRIAHSLLDGELDVLRPDSFAPYFLGAGGEAEALKLLPLPKWAKARFGKTPAVSLAKGKTFEDLDDWLRERDRIQRGEPKFDAAAHFRRWAAEQLE